MSFGDNPIVFLSKKLWQFSPGNRGNIILFFSLSVIAQLIAFIEPLVLAKILNTIQLSGITETTVKLIIFLLFVHLFLRVAFWAFHGPSRVIEQKNAYMAEVNYKKYLIDGVMALPAQWHSDHHSGNTIDKIEKSSEGLYTFSSSTFEIIGTLVSLVSSYFALIYFNLHASYLVGFIFIMGVIVISRYDTKLQKYWKNIYLKDNKASAKIFDTISNITTVIILRIEHLLSKEIFKKMMVAYPVYKKSSTLNETKWFVVSVFSSIMYITVIGSYVLLGYYNESIILVGTVTILFEYVRRVGVVFNRFAYKYGQIVRQKTAVENVEQISKLFSEKENIKEIHLGNKWETWCINNLSFSYHGKKSGNLHMKDVSLTFQRGEKIALIGDSGSGKTTFLKLLRGLYTPQSMTMTLDDKPIKDGLDAVSNNIALIPQDPEIFESSIRHNITLGIPHEDATLRKFMKAACFDTVVKKLPKKLNSKVFERGVSLSGGEKQRLALARGLLASVNKPIMLLDEPTSSVDIRNESNIYRNIFKMYKKKTIISTIHRLHLLHHFDKIYLFHRGKIVASGTLRELKRDSKAFQRIWDKYHKQKK